MDRPLCRTCENNVARKSGDGKSYRPNCDSCDRKTETRSARNKRGKVRAFPWKAHRKDYCEYPGCTTTIIHSCQLDVDHIDGNKKNNDPLNLMTICASCHRLKTFLNRDWDKKVVKSAVAIARMVEPKVSVI